MHHCEVSMESNELQSVLDLSRCLFSLNFPSDHGPTEKITLGPIFFGSVAFNMFFFGRGVLDRKSKECSKNKFQVPKCRGPRCTTVPAARSPRVPHAGVHRWPYRWSGKRGMTADRSTMICSCRSVPPAEFGLSGDLLKVFQSSTLGSGKVYKRT